MTVCLVGRRKEYFKTVEYNSYSSLNLTIYGSRTSRIAKTISPNVRNPETPEATYNISVALAEVCWNCCIGDNAVTSSIRIAQVFPELVDLTLYGRFTGEC